MTKKIKLVKNEIESAGKMPAKKRVEYNEKGLIEIFDWRTVREILSSIVTERINEKLWTDRHGRERRVKYNPWLGSFTVTFTPFGEGKEAKRKARKVPKPKIFYGPDEEKQYGVLYPNTKIKDSNERLYLQSIDNEEEETKVTESFVESVIDDATNFYLAIHGDSDEIEPTEENYLAIRGALDAIKDKSTGYRSLAKKWVKKLDEVWESKLEQEETNENQKPAQPTKPTKSDKPGQETEVMDKQRYRKVNNVIHLVVNAGEVTAFRTFLQAFGKLYDRYLAFKNTSVGMRAKGPKRFEKARQLFRELQALEKKVITGLLSQEEASKIVRAMSEMNLFVKDLLAVKEFTNDAELRARIHGLQESMLKPSYASFKKSLEKFDKSFRIKQKPSEVSSGPITKLISDTVKLNLELEREIRRVLGTVTKRGTLTKVALPESFATSVVASKNINNIIKEIKKDPQKSTNYTNLISELKTLKSNGDRVTKSRYYPKLFPESITKETKKIGRDLVEKSQEAIKAVTEMYARNRNKTNNEGNTMKKNLRKRSDVINHLVSNCKCNELDVEILSNLSNPVLQALAENFTENSSLKDEYSEMMDYDSVNEEDGEETTIMDVATLCEKFDIDPSDEDCLAQLKEVLQDTLEQLDSMSEESVLDGDNEDLEGDSDEIESLDEDSDEDELENMEDEYTEMMDYESLNEEEYVETKKNKSCRNKQNKEVERPQKNKKVANKNKSDKGKSNKGKSDESVLNNYLGAALPSLNGDGRGDDISPDDVYESPTLGF